MGDFTMWPVGSAGAATAGATGAAPAAGANGAATWVITGAYWCAIGCPPLTMRTLPSASVISSSETFDSDTRSINVFSLRKSIPVSGIVRKRTRIYSKIWLLLSFSPKVGQKILEARSNGGRRRVERNEAAGGCLDGDA